ncbi:glycosyltransferase family 2 protein [Agrobacterium sp. BA1120]|uniref:glycosyltransferase family 2 protein n=1 Tax=Agrobacterium sp. BA1120 TaxID=3228927 RepID=UPI00336A84D3
MSFSLKRFRRYPAKELATNTGIVGSIMAKLYSAVDVRGSLSNIIADPWTAIRCVVRLPCIYSVGSPPKVSVIIATRNNEKTIECAIKSLVNQDYRNIEMIIVDDASDDGSLQIIRSFAKTDERIKILTNKQRLGIGESRNTGLRVATGKYITFQDGDDYSLPSRISCQVQAFRNETIKLCLCNYVRINDSGEVLELNDRRVMKCIISMMFPREDIIDAVGYFRRTSIGEDSEYYERIKRKFGKSSEKVIFRTLYKAKFNENSSFFSNTVVTQLTSNKIKFEPTNKAVRH